MALSYGLLMRTVYETYGIQVIVTVIAGVIVLIAWAAIRKSPSLYRHLQVLWFRCRPSKAVCKLTMLKDRVSGLHGDGKPDRAVDELAAELALLRMHPPGINRLAGPERLEKEIAFLQKVTKASTLLSTVDLLTAARRELNDSKSELDFENIAFEEARQKILKEGWGDVEPE